MDVSTPLITAIRAASGSTAATHSNSTFLIKEPRFTFDAMSQALDRVIDNDLYESLYEIVEHQITSNAAANGTYYNAPAMVCEQFLEVYQHKTSPARKVGGISYTVYPQNADTSLWSNGKVFQIRGGTQDGSALYYVNCAHRLTLSTLLARQEGLVTMRAIQHLLNETEPKRLAGPTNQGDRTIRPGTGVQIGAAGEALFRRQLRAEARWLKRQTPPQKLFVRTDRPVWFTQPEY